MFGMLTITRPDRRVYSAHICSMKTSYELVSVFTATHFCLEIELLNWFLFHENCRQLWRS
jgi:hypothetical protein